MPIPFTINYLFESKAHVYLPDVIGQLLDGRLFIAEAGLEQDKLRERKRAKAEAARKVAEHQAGVYWIATETTPSKTRHANSVFLHARRQTFPTWQELQGALLVVWPWGEAACVQEVVERLGERWPQAEREAATWKRCAAAAARGHLLVDLTSVSLTRLTPLICLAPSTLPILPDPLPSEFPENGGVTPEEEEKERDQSTSRLATFDDSTLEGPQRVRGSRVVCELSKRYWLGHRSQIPHETCRSLPQPSRAWCGAPAHWACLPVCLMGPTAENGNCIPLFKKSSVDCISCPPSSQ